MQVKKWIQIINREDDNSLKNNSMIKKYNQENINSRNILPETNKENNITHIYKDITKEWLKDATPNSHEVKFDNYFMDGNGIKHPIKGKENVHIAYKDSDEYVKALWIKKTKGGNIHMVPRITDASNSKTHIYTPDYRINGKKYDLKTPTTRGKFESSIERFTKKPTAKLQSKRFIIDFKNYKRTPDEQIKDLALNQFKNPYRQWIEELILISDERLISVYKKQK